MSEIIEKPELFIPKAINYTPGTMGFAEGFTASRPGNGVAKYSDFGKAKNIIEKLIDDGRNIDFAEMGLDGDWKYNSMPIYKNGKFAIYCKFTESEWAKTILIVYFTDAPSETYDVWSTGEEMQNRYKDVEEMYLRYLREIHDAQAPFELMQKVVDEITPTVQNNDEVTK